MQTKVVKKTDLKVVKYCNQGQVLIIMVICPIYLLQSLHHLHRSQLSTLNILFTNFKQFRQLTTQLKAFMESWGLVELKKDKTA